jgi:hypothetical protein
MDFTVQFEVQVTAESPEEAAQHALDDLRDQSLGPWNADVSCSRGKKTVSVGTLGDIGPAPESANGVTVARVAVLCRNSEGAPEFHSCSVSVTKSQIEAGIHYELAKENAILSGYSGPMIAFDGSAPAARQMGDLLAWI